MTQMPVGRWGAAVLLLAAGAAACVRPPITVDPTDNPAVRAGAEAQVLPPPGAGIGGPQVPVPGPRGLAPVLSLPALQADFRATAGSDTVRFGRDDYLLDQAAQQTLALQAAWLRQHPFVRASIEGHADVRQTREHALGLAERRAAAVHNFLVSQGVAPTQLSVISWGKERPAVAGVHDAAYLQNSRVVTVLAR